MWIHVDPAGDWFSVSGVGDGGRPAHPPKQKHRVLCCGWEHFPGRERSVTMLNQKREENTKISLSSFQDTVAFILSWCAECFPWPPNEAAKHRPLNISCIISLHRPFCPRHLSHISFYPLHPHSPGEELHPWGCWYRKQCCLSQWIQAGFTQALQAVRMNMIFFMDEAAWPDTLSRELQPKFTQRIITGLFSKC